MATNTNTNFPITHAIELVAVNAALDRALSALDSVDVESVLVPLAPVASPQRDSLLCEYSDLYKDMWGVRPRNGFTSWSLSRLESEVSNLYASIQDELADDPMPTSGDGWAFTPAT